MPPTHRVRVLIADRRPIAARGLAVALEERDEFVVARCCHAAGKLPGALGAGGTIDAVVIDVEMFEGDASRSAQAVRGVDARVAVLLLTTRVDAQLLDAIAHDSVSCVSAYSEADAIAAALLALIRGQTHLPPDVQRALMDVVRQPAPAPCARLTSREEQVLELAATGLTVFQIATALHISHSTAKTHLLRVYEKLEAPNRSAAVATALARGLLHVSSTAA